jgi:hypothetical protein
MHRRNIFLTEPSKKRAAGTGTNMRTVAVKNIASATSFG